MVRRQQLDRLRIDLSRHGSIAEDRQRARPQELTQLPHDRSRMCGRRVIANRSGPTAPVGLRATVGWWGVCSHGFDATMLAHVKAIAFNLNLLLLM